MADFELSLTETDVFQALMQLIVNLDEENPELNIVPRLEAALLANWYVLEAEEVQAEAE